MGPMSAGVKGAWDRVARLVAAVWQATPRGLQRAVRNRITILVSAAAVAGFVGNRVDWALVARVLPWLAKWSEVPNVVIVLALVPVFVAAYFAYGSFVLEAKLGQYEQASRSPPEASLLRNSDSFYPELTKLVTGAPVRSDLLVSIGEGDFVHGWLLRIFEDAAAGRGAAPKIQRVAMRCLSAQTCVELRRLGWIDRHFEARMNRNIAVLKKALAKHGVAFELRPWPSLPPFHGFVFGHRFLTNSWAVGPGGHLHVRTPLLDRTAECSPEAFEATIATFNA